MFSSGDGSTPYGLFNRWAVVGLSDSKWGTIRIGRAMSLTDNEMWAVDPMGMQTSSVANLVNGRIWGSRANAITYDSPEYGAFSYRAQVGLGEQPGNSQANRQLSVSGKYKSGNLDVRAVYEEIRDANGGFSNLYAASREYALGANYTFNALKLYGGYSQLRSDNATIADANNTTGANQNDMAWIGANYDIGNLKLLTGLYHAKVNGSGGSGTLLSVGAQYYLSKQTMLYATLAGINNAGAANFSVEQTGNTQPLAGTSQQGTYAGMMHWF